MSIHGRIASAFFVSFAVSTLSLSVAAAKDDRIPVPESVPGQFLVRFKNPGAVRSSVALQSMEEKTKGKIIRSHVEQNFVILQKPLIQSMGSALQEIQSVDDVLYVEPNFVYRATKTSNDPDLGQLWGLKNVGQVDAAKQAGVTGIDVDAERAWDITTGSANTIVAVIDSGLDYNHPDLMANAWTNTLEANGQPGVDDDNNGLIDDIHGANFVNPAKPTGDPMDDHGHGTHCSGTVGGKGNDGRGIVGVAWDVKIIGVKFLNEDGSGNLEAAIQAVDYATKMGARIMSNSWAGGGYSKFLEEAIQRADAAGVLFVAASSNASGDNDAIPVYPASYHSPNIVVVAAIDNRGGLAEFSNYGKTTVHIAAPGVNIFSSVHEGNYATWSGTSMATPHVSGVAALLVSADPTLTHYQLKDRLLAGARPMASLRHKVITGGVVNAYYSLTQQTPPDDPNDPAKWAHQTVNFATSHPYLKKDYMEHEIDIPGANEIALFFSSFETERNYDTVTLLDRAGNSVAVLHGTRGEGYSPLVKGDYVKIVFRADDSIEKHGFDLTGAAYR